MKYLVSVLLMSFFCNCVSKQNNTKETINESQIESSVIDSLKFKLNKITETKEPRNYKNLESLNNVALYINNEFNKVCDSTRYQKFSVEENVYKNVIGSLGTQNKERIIIGAHYDVCGNSDGADDNASGVVGLLELANRLSKEKLKYRIDFVAYTLEEPPFFKTLKMGSYIHAKYLKDNEIFVKGMLCLESIGYFSEQPNSQDFPVEGMSLKYGNVGNFITIVQNKSAKEFSNTIKTLMEGSPLIRTESFKGSPSLTGVDFSDHLNYWKFNYDAVMITNTAFFRNKHYHTNGDVIGTLDLEKMSLVIEQLYQTIMKIK